MLDQQTNDSFSSDEISEQFRSILARCWNKNSQSGFALSTEDISNIEKTRNTANELLNSYFERITETAQRRRQNLQQFSRFRFVSVGEDCFSRTLLTRWGFKLPAKLGEKSGPFDLAIHPLVSTVKLIQNRFEDYLNVENLIFDEQRKVASNSLYNVLFNHEVGAEWAAENFLKLRTTYERRIKNFFSSLDEQEPIFFVLHIRYPSTNQLNLISQLADELHVSPTECGNKLICVATWSHNSDINTQQRENLLTRGISFIDVKYPFANYVWYNELHASSASGYDFELTIASELNKIVCNNIKEQHEKS